MCGRQILVLCRCQVSALSLTRGHKKESKHDQKWREVKARDRTRGGHSLLLGREGVTDGGTDEGALLLVSSI